VRARIEQVPSSASRLTWIASLACVFAVLVPCAGSAQTAPSDPALGGPALRGIEIEREASQGQCALQHGNAPVMTSNFDRQLGRLLSSAPSTPGAIVAVNPVSPFMRDAAPPALVPWLEAVAKTGGSVKLEALDCGNERFGLGGVRDFFSGLLGVKRGNRYERQVRDYNAILYQDPANLKIVQIAFVRRPSGPAR
jgi:hypothetical protein